MTKKEPDAAAIPPASETPTRTCIACVNDGPLVGYTFDMPGPFCRTCWEQIKTRVYALNEREAATPAPVVPLHVPEKVLRGALDILRDDLPPVVTDSIAQLLAAFVVDTVEPYARGIDPPAPVVPPWQDISTAPKDGTPILCHVKGGAIYVCWYYRAAWRFCEEYATRPMHWMPLPAPPSGSPSAPEEETR